jgi:AcrR family transcriptional regulator
VEAGADRAARNGAESDGRATPERIVAAGIRLFADRGFQGTTVGEIEREAGLSPRAGALYKHFPSKEAVLEAAIERHINELEGMSSAIELMPLGDLRAELTLLARWGLRMLAEERDLRRIVITEGERFPTIKRRYRERIVDRAYGAVTTYVSYKMDQGELPVGDPEALATAMVTSLLGYQVEREVFDRAPAGVEEERFINTVVDAFVAAARGARKARA